MTQIKPWIEISRETIFQKYGYKMDKVIFKLPSGTESDYYLTGKDGRIVAVLPIDENNQVILVKQFRPGPQKIISELPGGGVEKNEDPITAIKREFLEESGHTGDFELITESMTDAYSGAIRYHFVARNCKKIAEPKNSDCETTEVVTMNLDEFKKHLKSGQISDIATGYFGLDYLGLIG